MKQFLFARFSKIARYLNPHVKGTRVAIILLWSQSTSTIRASLLTETISSHHYGQAKTALSPKSE